MRSVDSILLSISLTILGSVSAGQSTWYVDVNGAPPGTGTSADPYTSIQYAISQPTTHDGDTVLVAPGTYVGNVSIDPGVKLRSLAGPIRTIIQGTVHLVGASSLPPLIDGFTVPLVYMGGATWQLCSMRRCIVRAPAPGATVGVFYDDYTVIENCVVTGYQTALQMFAFAFSTAQIRNTIFYANGVVNGSQNIALFDHCCLPSTSMPVGCTQVNTAVGDPGFWDPYLGDYHLRPGSICIDAGSPTSPLDPDGTIADIGAIPFDPLYLPQPQTYCSSELNGDGCMATVSASGACSATSASPFTVAAVGIPPNKLGRVLYSFTPASTPFQGGTLCLGAPIHRTDPSYSGSNGMPPPLDLCSGVLAFDFNARIQSGIDPELMPGRVVYAQFRYRDPLDPLGYGVGWSNAIRFAIGP